jgi:hypothetical protein
MVGRSLKGILNPFILALDLLRVIDFLDREKLIASSMIKSYVDALFFGGAFLLARAECTIPEFSTQLTSFEFLESLVKFSIDANRLETLKHYNIAVGQIRS